MKRRLTAAALVLIFPLSMAACGSQSTADACKEISTARTSVHQYSAEHSILDMPFDEVPDHLKKLLDSTGTPARRSATRKSRLPSTTS